jgi:hypothetical protein
LPSLPRTFIIQASLDSPALLAWTEDVSMHRCLAVVVLAVAAAPAVAADFQPDPRTVQRWGPAYRYPQDGWIVLHIEGEPYERGVQHGRLLGPEIAAHVRCFSTILSPRAPEDGWKHTRTLVNSLFLRRYEKEFLEEMKGIADGASAAGARFHGRPIDLIDVVALNSWPEIETLDHALEATATGLENIRFSTDAPRPKVPPKPMHCSAFAAVGPATADGKIVFGHITMFGLYPSSFYNVWIDLKPVKGHRVLMQSYPAGIQSGLDYYINDAGLLVAETTLAQTRFDIRGLTVASRIRAALQYADSIDKACAILEKENNGLYTNEWLLADIKTNEIAMFELGTHRSRLYRSSKNEWFGGTEGFYWGCNNTKDLEVRLETVAATDGRPANPVFHPSPRDRKWLELYDKHKGKIDVDFGKLAFTTPPLAAFHSVDAKFTTTAMAKELRSWALFGPPLGRTWQPTIEERKRYPEIQPLVGNPWTILHTQPPSGGGEKVVDLHNPEDGKVLAAAEHAIKPPPSRPAWFGTLLPESDADTWLAAAFAEYEKYVALETALKKEHGGTLPRGARDYLDVELFAHRSAFERASRARPEGPLSRTRTRLRDSDWYHVAAGKGVLLLHALRHQLGDDTFLALMETFGRENGGKATSTAQFRAAAEKAGNGKLRGFFDTWLNDTGLPSPQRGVEGQAALRCGPFAVTTPEVDLEEMLIVYGTEAERPTNREAAEALQDAIRTRWSNITVPLRSDREVTEEELSKHHVLLIGRPDSNRVVRQFQDSWPVQFGLRSFAVRGEVYAHAGTGVIAAGENPRNRRYAALVYAGLSPAAMLRIAPALGDREERAAEVVVLPHGSARRSFVVPQKQELGRGGEKPASGGGRR